MRTIINPRVGEIDLHYQARKGQMRQRRCLASVAVVVAVGVGVVAPLPQVAQGQNEPYVLTFKDNKLEPAELQVPAGQDFKLVVKNADQTPEEFESGDLKIEKIIAGGGAAEFTIKGLEAGSYEVHGEFHEDTAKGHIVAK
jgi:plastocyanin